MQFQLPKTAINTEWGWAAYDGVG